MDANRWKKIDELVDAALEVSVIRREEFVSERSGDDNELRDAVLELLRAQTDADGFLNDSAMRVAARAIADDETSVSERAFVQKTIATYTIERLLGAGGMGEVYLAFDEKMKRRVALKILPAEYGSNDERVKRFGIEARAISSINHPGIVTIYDVGDFEGINYFATEFVEGKTLRDLIGGEFKLRNVMANSIQICDALSAAHAEGIIHRDIKPENVMIRTDGYAKILDFGVAKLTENSPDARLSANTTKSVIIGTPSYMSPSQVSGDSIDHRTDIWSCGVVLFEFLTGQNPFKGATRQATFEAILTRDPPPPSELNPEIPEELDRILLKILEKDRELGYQSAADLRADLKRVKRELDSSPSGTFSGSSAAYRRRRSLPRQVGVALAAGLVLAAGVAVWALFFRGGKSPDATDWSTATRTQLTVAAGTEHHPTLSPDGKTVVYAARENGSFDLFSLRIGGRKPLNLTQSPGDDTQAAFSPNGELIAFRSSRDPGGIYVMGATGENVKRVSEYGFHPSWSPDGREIVVSRSGVDLPLTRNSIASEISIINVETGERRLLATIDAMQPTWSPNGKMIACWFHPPSVGRRDVALIPAGGGEPVIITTDGTTNWNPVWSPDGKFLYFASDRGGSMNFWRMPVDESGMPTSGPEAVETPAKYSRHINFSGDGKRLVFVSTDNRSNLRAVNFDPVSLKTVGEPFWITQGDRQVNRPDLSPDGTRFVLRLPRRSQDDIVVMNRDGSNHTDITNDTFFDRYPRWSPDGKQIAFTSDRTGMYQIHVVNADGTNLRRITDAPATHATFPIWSHDGRSIFYRTHDKTYVVDAAKMWNEQTPEELPNTQIEGSMFSAWDMSTDGKLLAGSMGGSPMRVGYYSLTERKLFPLTESKLLPAWLPNTGKMLYGVGQSVNLIDIESGKSVELFTTDENISSIGVSLDGTLLYYVSALNESDIWLLDATAPKP